jgi:hypothetical protein
LEASGYDLVTRDTFVETTHHNDTDRRPRPRRQATQCHPVEGIGRAG